MPTTIIVFGAFWCELVSCANILQYRFVYSTCNICSNGCGCYIAVKDDKIVGIMGNEHYPVNRGRLGPKGENQWWANNSVDRLKTPLIRHNGKLLSATWENAYSLLVEKTQEVLKRKGPSGLALYHTGQAYLEDYYTISKITRAGLRMHHVDANTRLCTATAEWSLIESFGSDGPPACQEDVDITDVIVFIGRNSSETNTVFWERVLEARRRNGTKIIEIDTRRDISDKMADLSLQPRSGTNVAVLNGIIHLLIKNNWIDPDYIRNHTIGFEELKQTVSRYHPSFVEQITTIPSAKLAQCAEWIGTSKKTLTVLLQGVYQSLDATAAATLVNLMHLIMGKIGKPGSGPFQHAGQPSAMSNRETGGAGFYPGYRNNSNPKHIAEMSRLWNVNEEILPVGPQTFITEIIQLIEQGEIDLFWVMFTNPAVSLPNRNRMISILKKPFLVVQDPFLSETAELADLVLPTALWGEKEWTMTNLERRVNVLRKAVNPPYNLPSDFEILLEFSKRMGFKDRDGRPLISYMVRVTSKRGSIQVPARITDAVRKGAIFIPFHYGTLTENQAANVLTLETWDLVSKQPHFKNGACRIEKIMGQEGG